MNGTNYEVPHCGAISTPHSHPPWTLINSILISNTRTFPLIIFIFRFHCRPIQLAGFVPVGPSSLLRYLRQVSLGVEASSVARPGQLTIGLKIIDSNGHLTRPNVRRNFDTQPLIKSNFAEHIFNTHHTFTNIETNLEILHTLPKGPKLNTAEQYNHQHTY